MLSISDYLSLFSPGVREKPRFMALAGAVLSQVDDLLLLVQTGFPAAFSLETAVGVSLDMIGELLDIPRPGPEISDEDYRFFLKLKIRERKWDGTNETLRPMLEEAFTPEKEPRMSDYADFTVVISFTGEEDSPFEKKSLFPMPPGVRTR